MTRSSASPTPTPAVPDSPPADTAGPGAAGPGATGPGAAGPDPRPVLAAAAAQVGALVHAATPDRFPAPTPCAEYDVHRLLQHLVGVAGRIAHIGAGGRAMEVPSIVEQVPGDDWGRAWDTAWARAQEVWADDAVLDRVLNLPWGDAPGRAAGFSYVQELTVHGWDLASALGLRDRLDDALAAGSLEPSRRFVPAEPRGGRIPFGPVVAVPDDAGPYDRLVAWLGRDPAWKA